MFVVFHEVRRPVVEYLQTTNLHVSLLDINPRIRHSLGIGLEFCLVLDLHLVDQQPDGDEVAIRKRRSYLAHLFWHLYSLQRRNQILNRHRAQEVVALNRLFRPVRLRCFRVPHFFQEEIPEGIAYNPLKYYFIRIRCRFNLKEGYLPFVQIKSSIFYRINEMLETSDIKHDGRTIRYYRKDGETQEHRVELTLTKTDYEMLLKFYDVDYEILDGCWFDATRGLFDFYIEKYRKIKQENTGALRLIAKLFLNNLYGQEAKSPNSSYKVARLDEGGNIVFHDVIEYNKKVVYIPIGAAITSYARAFTISAAQSNYEHFIYADTDSIHCACDPEQVKGITVDDTAFQCWSLENVWNTGFFHRQKTYIEIGKEAIVKAAGMPDESKAEFLQGMESGRFTLEDFKQGLELTGKLMPARVPGGVVLRETTYVMRD